jgi:peptidoglycan/LPS O-acetylase OafA/YrhL
MSPAHAAYLRQPYFPALDGLRAVCVLLVVTVHLFAHQDAWAWLAGARGVTVFFVLSGYLITTLALREEDRAGRVHLAAFYVRRCCRLFPLYYLVLALYAGLFALGLGRPDQRDAFACALPWYLFYLQEVPFYDLLVTQQRDLPFFQTWSLGIEEKFYLLWPLIAFFLWRGSHGRRLTGTTALVVLFGLGPPLLGAFDPTYRLVARNLHSYYPILAGCLLALVLHGPTGFERLRALLGRGRVALALFGAVHLAGPQVGRPWGTEIVNVLYPLAAAGLVASLVCGSSPIRNLLAWRPLVFAGQLSYGAYLVHLLALAAVYRALPALVLGHPVRSVVAFALSAAVSFAAAWGLRLLVEARCVRLGQRWSARLKEAPWAPLGNGAGRCRPDPVS